MPIQHAGRDHSAKSCAGGDDRHMMSHDDRLEAIEPVQPAVARPSGSSSRAPFHADLGPSLSNGIARLNLLLTLRGHRHAYPPEAAPSAAVTRTSLRLLTCPEEPGR